MKKHIFILAVGLALAQFSNGVFAQQSAPGTWAGWARCQINVQGPGYTDQQTHTWTITGGAPTTQGAFQIYAATWAVVGGGSLSRTQGTQTLMAQWATNAPDVSAPIAVFVRASDNRMFIQSRHAQLRSTAAIQGYQQVTISGKPQTPGKIDTAAFEWGFPVIAVSAPVPPNTNATATGSSTSSVNGSVGIMQPAGSRGTAECTWQFGQGSAAPAPPPTLTAQAIPTPGNPATTSPPANNPPGPTSPATGRLTRVVPTSIEQGVSPSDVITLTGEGTHWQQGTTEVNFGPGITIQGGVRVLSPMSLTTQLAVSYAAASGPRAVTVTTGNETVTLPSALTIVAREQPVITQISPNSAPAGTQNLTVILTGRGTRWEQGTTALLPVAGFGVSSFSVSSPTSVSFTLNIDPAAAVGPREIKVLNRGVVVGSDIITVADGFTVNPPGSASSLTATPLNPLLLPAPVLCSMRGPSLNSSRPTYVSPGRVNVQFEAVTGATGYNVSRNDLGLLTATPLTHAGIYEHNPAFTAPVDYSATYVYAITALYPGGCGSTTFTVSPRRPGPPRVTADTRAGGGRVSFRAVVPDYEGSDYAGVLVKGPAMPSTGRIVMKAAPLDWHVDFNIDGVPAGMRTWVITAFWDLPGGRVLDESTGARVTVDVP